MSGGIPMERMTPEEIARLKLRCTNRDGSAEVLTSKAWAHITLQDAEIEKLRADIAYADTHAAKVESLLWGTAKEREKLRAAVEPFADMGKAMMGRKHPNEAVVQYALAPTIKVFHLVAAHEARAAITQEMRDE